jgi:regulator of protease activity HflC (stomatin/prohibitin superfamily)
MIRSTAESVLRATISTHPLDDVLTERRAQLEQASGEELQRRIAKFDLGVEVLGLQWLDVHPPRPVVAAYRQVSDAWEQKEQAVNEARALATRTLFGTAGEAAIEELARQPAENWSLTDEAWKSLSTPNDAGQRRLSGTAGAVLLDAEAAAERERAAARGQAARLRTLLAATRPQPELSRQYLYWTAVIEALSGKPFTLIDPALSGRRQLFLGDIPREVIALPMGPNPEK